MKLNFLLKFYGILFITAGVIFIGFFQLPSGKLEVSILDIGQGDAIFIRTPQNQKILIDAGPATNVLHPLARELSFFERQIDLVILTHPDYDHIAGFTEVLRRYKVKNVLLTGVQHDTAEYREVLAQIVGHKIPVLLADAEMDFDFGAGVYLDIVWPCERLAGEDPADSNESSIVARLSFGQTSILMTGDFGVDSEFKVLKTSQNLCSDALKLGHHGSSTSSSEDFLAAVNSKIALVSAGQDNRFGHPKPEILARVSDQAIYETAKSGSIKLISDGSEWQIKTEK